VQQAQQFVDVAKSLKTASCTPLGTRGAAHPNRQVVALEVRRNAACRLQKGETRAQIIPADSTTAKAHHLLHYSLAAPAYPRKAWNTTHNAFMLLNLSRLCSSCKGTAPQVLLRAGFFWQEHRGLSSLDTEFSAQEDAHEAK
jgi:hypothetical protein